MIRWFFKWLFRLAILAVVLVVLFLLSLNTLLRVYVEHSIRAQTGMDAEIDRFKLGWAEPTIEIKDLKIYNSPAFGGTPFLDIPEIHIEYDPKALARGSLHLTLLRINVAELDIVKSTAGRTNIFELAGTPRKGKATVSKPASQIKSQTGYDFTGIDKLNVSFGTAKYIDLQNRHNDRQQTIGIQNCVVPDVKSANDLAGLAVVIGLRSNHFFDQFIGQPRNSASMKSILNLMGAPL